MESKSYLITTQDEYNKLMKYLEEQGFTWDITGRRPTKPNYFFDRNEQPLKINAMVRDDWKRIRFNELDIYPLPFEQCCGYCNGEPFRDGELELTIERYGISISTAHEMFGIRASYCPMCGRKLGE